MYDIVKDIRNMRQTIYWYQLRQKKNTVFDYNINVCPYITFVFFLFLNAIFKIRVCLTYMDLDQLKIGYFIGLTLLL